MTKQILRNKSLIMRSREARADCQQLIDILFQFMMMYHAGEIYGHTRESLAEYMREQLKQCGFPTKPVGSSWAVIEQVNE